MKIINLKNKKAMEPSTLTWVVAMFIIFFMLIIFMVATLAISKGKFGIPLETKEEKKTSDLTMIENTLAFLNTESEYNGEKILIKDLVLSSLDPYMNQEHIMKLLRGDINYLDYYYDRISAEFFVLEEFKKAKEKEDFIFNELKQVLNPICEKYMLKIPRGTITNIPFGLSGESGGYIDEETALRYVNDESLRFEWTDWANVKIPYKGKTIEIKYRRLKKC